MREQKCFPGYLVASALALALFLTGGMVSAGGGGGNDLVDTAVEAGSFDTLVAAVKAAGLVEALKGDGPFTVFAPSDEAFAKLPAGTEPDGFNAWKAQLQQWLFDLSAAVAAGEPQLFEARILWTRDALVARSGQSGVASAPASRST